MHVWQSNPSKVAPFLQRGDACPLTPASTAFMGVVRQKINMTEETRYKNMDVA
jgi:hypothetical protein